MLTILSQFIFRSENELDADLMTRYVCLMCKEEPEKVHSIVKNHENIELDPAIAVSNTF